MARRYRAAAGHRITGYWIVFSIHGDWMKLVGTEKEAHELASRLSEQWAPERTYAVGRTTATHRWSPTLEAVVEYGVLEPPKRPNYRWTIAAQSQGLAMSGQSRSREAAEDAVERVITQILTPPDLTAVITDADNYLWERVFLPGLELPFWRLHLGESGSGEAPAPAS